ncbi:hypothetical protein H074_32794 [Amycolatopsis decaplanina DSM 44594]|uniref:ANTAR domain-containing protein n=1 Tax=Amycolatopsis decaplanina DSM 44594 TaxID=1284240 RepID=M2YVJ5_9PSEU|nr:hypothetical protein H074_32794 [Amycolatopsis decaplanina DSM 44594]
MAGLLADLGHAARAGHGLPAVPAGTAHRFGMDALTVSALHDGLPELVWCDPADGIGPELEELQFTLGDGPTLQAARYGRSLIELDLPTADPARWPTFLPAAIPTAARTVIAIPLQLGAATLGVLTGYHSTPATLTTARQRDLRRLSRVLLFLLLNSTGTAPEDETGPRAHLILHRAEIHQATGFLSLELGIPLDQALARLRAHAAAHDQTTTDLAQALLTHRTPPEALNR